MSSLTPLQPFLIRTESEPESKRRHRRRRRRIQKPFWWRHRRHLWRHRNLQRQLFEERVSTGQTSMQHRGWGWLGKKFGHFHRASSRKSKQRGKRRGILHRSHHPRWSCVEVSSCFHLKYVGFVFNSGFVSTFYGIWENLVLDMIKTSKM